MPNVIRSDMDVGPAKVRRRYTATIKQYGLRMVLTKAQIATLETFIDSTLGGGALTFDWVDHRTGAAATYRFIGRPAYQTIGAEYWSADMALELLP